jgi:7-keto-8-aminopelargonate synthetase-like enzyme
MNPISIPTFPGREIFHNGKSYLYFGGTSYLGMQCLAEFKELLASEIGYHGTNYGASRLSNIRINIYDKVENHLSTWVGSDASLVLSSGYLAGQLLANYFEKGSYKLFYTAQAHTSLYRGDQMVFEDYGELRNALVRHLNSGDKKSAVLFLDTVDLSPDTFPHFEGLKKLPLESCILVADDSHGIGLLGSNGTGSSDRLRNMTPGELVVCSSLGKALGIQAGAIFGSSGRINDLKQTSFFAGASPPPAAYMATLMKATTLYTSQRSKLMGLLTLFQQELSTPEMFKSIAHYPVFEFRDKRLAAFLFKQGICISDFSYPSESDAQQSRIVISASHRPEDIVILAQKINNYQA